ncbi:MAG: AI-2E family transporter [Gammaproteobacteria bacterium]|nr:AI-2E family transporter [Gammaproteobacteria bacterium]MCG3142966.1 putative transport protein [Gammaproteobacteria bacterium]
MILIVVVAGGWLLYRLAPVLTPFMASAVLAYLGDPLVDRLERRGLSRTVSVVVVFVAMALLGVTFLLIMIPLLQRQATVLMERIPQGIQWLQERVLPYLLALPGLADATIDLDTVRQAVTEHWQQVGTAVTRVLAEVTASGRAVFAALAYLLLIPVVTFYLLRDWDVLVRHMHALIPRSVEPTVVRLTRECDAVLAQFLRGQLLVMLGLAFIYTTGLWTVGLDSAFLIGMLAGLVSFVPYLGFIVGIVLAGFAALIQYGDALHLLYVVAVFGVGQLIEGFVLSPWLVGDRIGLHPVAVIFAVMAGGQLFGFFGVLLALPVAAVVLVLLRHSHELYLQSSFYTP